MKGIFKKIRNLVKQTPKGKVTTYGKIAKTLKIKDSRLVGWAIWGNTDSTVPCHRAVMKDGSVAKNYSLGGGEEQKRRLEKEGVKFINKKRVNLKKFFWKPL